LLLSALKEFFVICFEYSGTGFAETAPIHHWFQHNHTVNPLDFLKQHVSEYATSDLPQR
jgi:hypothetical protein